MLAVGHIADEMCQTFMLRTLLIVDKHKVEAQTMHLEVLECTQQLFGMSGALGAVYLHQQDGQVAAYAVSPQSALRKCVLGQCVLAGIAQCGGLCHVFRDAVVQPHLRPFQQRHAGPHVVKHRSGLESMLHVDVVLILLCDLQQLFARLGKPHYHKGVHLFAGRHMQSASHTHDGVEGCAHCARQCAAAFQNVGVTQAATASYEFQSRSLEFH